MHGLPVTTLARTAVDCARALAGLPALVVADAALRAGCSPDELAAAARRCDGQRGARRAREVLALADGGAESAGETWVRAVLLAAGLPAPTTQLQVETRRGPVWADLGWPGARLLLEYDGRGKYVTPEDLYREKQRHDALVEAGWTVLRVTADDCARPDELVARVVRAAPALRRVARRRPVLAA
ncbi:hypothetical protein ACFUMH_11925 [Cellulomonas sp. NPDC057328]|uniref:hypothetical protein n=1 Tax=Cellulomonas sp. NPDC057328 TaxID=3346101 RepID=UPI0036367F36